MSKAVKLVDQLYQDHRWKFSQQGFCIALKRGNPEGCFIFDSWERHQIDQFAAALKKIGAPIDLKLIGGVDFINTLRRWAEKQGVHVIKSVVRDVPFEMIYSATNREFKINVSLNFPKTAQNRKTKVLIVDDSSTIRRVLRSIFKTDPDIQVIGSLENPMEVLSFLEAHRPDVITLDVHMPEMDGIQLLRQIVAKYSIPTIMISSLSKEDGPHVLDALEIGAFDYIQKPSFQDIPLLGPHILERVRTAAESKKIEIKNSAPVHQIVDPWNHNGFILIGASTGGTDALAHLLKQFPDEIPPVLVVQHIPPIFSKAFADRLNSIFKFEVREAKNGDKIERNTVLIAPGGQQMGIAKLGDSYFVTVRNDAPVNRHKPSVDYLFHSAAKLKMHSLIGVVLTGMGSDGAKGLLELRRQGAHTVVQDEKTSVVYGMPRCAFELGAAEAVVPLDQIGAKIARFLHKNQKGE